MSKKVLIIGAGIGGLGVANLLAQAGHEVHVYEKESTPGGRAGQHKVKGFTFDTGPSWYLMPTVFDHYFDLLGESTEKWLTLKKLTPAYKVFFEDSTPITITGSLASDAKTFEHIEPGAGEALKNYVAKGNTIYQLSLKHFLYSNFQRTADFLKSDIFKNLPILPKLLTQPIDRYVSGFVKDRRLRQILEYPMVFLGTSPFTAPSMYSLMSALDFKEGVFYPQGGMYEIIKSIVGIGKQRGVTYHFNEPVKSIASKGGVATGIVLSSGKSIHADIVISNADMHYTETKLLQESDQTYPERYWKNKEAGPSALLMYLGVNKKVPEFEHHNLLLVNAWKENFSAIYDTKTIPESASIYISKTSQTDPSVAPKGHENIFVLVPLPSEVKLTPKRMQQLADHYMKQIETSTGVSLKESIVVQELFGPNEFLTKFHAWKSSMLGQSHVLKQSAFFRTPNVSKKLKNLYYVGANTTPGIGLPMCLISAELVYKRIVGDKRSGQLTKIAREQ
jgi:phytoene desaturase